jgi:hypothetical protein
MKRFKMPILFGSAFDYCLQLFSCFCELKAKRKEERKEEREKKRERGRERERLISRK